MNRTCITKTLAKVNLSLAVTGKRGNLHTLDMIVLPCEPCDEITFFYDENARGIESIKFIEAFDGFDEERFLKFFAPKANAIAKKLKVGGSVEICKNIPLGGGLGGSSACTVGLIKAMLLFSSESPDTDFLLSLGSDVPAMYMGGILRVQGIGEILTPLSTGRKIRCDIRIADGGVDSGECYALYDKLLEEGKIDIDQPIPTTVDEALSALRNDLTLPATIINPDIKALMDKLSEQYDKVIMTGSGSAVVGITLE